ncbi:MAG: nonstructural protein [Microviridae sp.]|nr:MAG: nonstructural protein [Microviridae sp.]
MKISYFSIFDKKSNLFSQLFPSHTAGSAERSFQDSINKPDSVHYAHPDDYALYHCFDYDDETSRIIVAHDPPNLIVDGSQLKQ